MVPYLLSRFLTEWKSDQRKSQITIRHLLSLTSGIFGGSTREASPSYGRAVIIAGAKFWPGQRFQYGPIPCQVFGELMRRKLTPRNESVEVYLKRIIPSLELVVVQFAETEQFDQANFLRWLLAR